MVSFRYSPGSPYSPGLALFFFLPFTSIAFYVDFLVDGSFRSRRRSLLWKSREVSPPVHIFCYFFFCSLSATGGFVVETQADGRRPPPTRTPSVLASPTNRKARGEFGIMRGGGGGLEVGGWMANTFRLLHLCPSLTGRTDGAGDGPPGQSSFIPEYSFLLHSGVRNWNCVKKHSVGACFLV